VFKYNVYNLLIVYVKYTCNAFAFIFSGRGEQTLGITFTEPILTAGTESYIIMSGLNFMLNYTSNTSAVGIVSGIPKGVHPLQVDIA